MKKKKEEEILEKEQNRYDITYIKDIIFIPFYHQWGTRYTEKLRNSPKVTQAVKRTSELSWSGSRINVLNHYDMSPFYNFG